MKDIYYINLVNFSLDKFEKQLTTKDLLPGRRVLLEEIEERFEILRKAGISNLRQLLDQLKNKKKIENIAQETNIPAEYLTILRREAGSMLPTPVNLEKLVELENCHYVEALVESGIKNSKQFFESAYLITDRKKLSQKTAIPYEILAKWIRLCDLLRINGVGPVFAHMLYDAGIRSVRYFSETPKEQLLEQILIVNAEKSYTKVKLTIKDIDYCLDFVRELELVLEED
jgi:replicative superfamily II helicase